METDSSNCGFNALQRLKRVFKQKENEKQKSRSGIYFDQPKENIVRSESSCSIDLTQYKKGSLEIKIDSENLSSRQGSFDFNNLFNSRPNIYTRTLQKMESFISVVGNNSQGGCIESCRLNTCESRPENPREIYNTISVGPRSDPSKMQTEENFVKVQQSDFELIKEASLEKSAEKGEENPEKVYQEKISKLSKDNKELRRKLNKQAQEHSKKIEELEKKYKAEIEELKTEMEAKILEANKESDIVAESMREQLECEVRKSEALTQQVAELEEQIHNLKEVNASIEDNETTKQLVESLRKEMEEMRESYEEKINELQECHIEGELASAVQYYLTIGRDKVPKKTIRRTKKRRSRE
jgi:hypothetical protein